MPFLENLVQGFAGAAGADDVVQRIEKRKSDRKATADEELHANTQSILNDVQGLQERRSKLDPNSPTYQKDVGEIDAALLNARRTFTDLYHPAKNPGALDKLGGFIKSHLGGKKQQPSAPATPGQFRQGQPVTPERIAALDASAAGGGQVATNPILVKRKQMQEAGFSAEQIHKVEQIDAGLEAKEKPESENWVPANVKFADGAEVTLQRNSKSGEWTDLAGNAIPKERLATATITPKTTGAPKVAWKKLPNGKYVSMQLDANNQFKKGTENYDQAPPASIVGRISTGNYHYVDEKGQVHQIQETRTSVPVGSSAAATIPKTPGQAKAQVAKVAPAKDNVIGFKGSKDYIDTKAAYEGAVDRTDTMEKNLVNALNGDQQAMLSLVANHIGMTLGAQKGARINRAVWDEAIASTPWLAKIAAKWSDDGYLSGVTLAPEQMKQMVRLAHEKTQTLKDHLGRLDSERQSSGQADMTDDDKFLKQIK